MISDPLFVNWKEKKFKLHWTENHIWKNEITMK